MSSSGSRLTVRSPADLVAAVPYLIGFHPGEGSLVLVAIDGARVVFAARADLPAPDAPPTRVRDLAAHLIPVVRRQDPITTIVLIGYGNPAHLDPALHTVERLFTTAGLPVRELLRVTDQRVFNRSCTSPTCCPTEGIPVDPLASPVAAQATVAGLVALPDRAAMLARLAPVDGPARAGMRLATDRARLGLAQLDTAAAPDAMVRQAGEVALREALRQHDTGEHLSDHTVAWLTVLLARAPVRDLATGLTQPCPGHVAFWTDVTRRAQPPYLPAPATLLALTAWRCGDGTLATLAAEHALRADPTYPLAALLLQALHVGLPPSAYQQP